MILYVKACPRADSRTDRLARLLLKKLERETGMEMETVDLETEALQPLNAERLARRSALIEAGDYSDPLFRHAKQFAAADIIVIAAPFWDLSYPACLKIYLENVYVSGLVSVYDAAGVPRGLCRAEKLYYVTTAGGPYQPDYSYAQIRDLALHYFGIGETALLKAELLDIIGNDPEQILQAAAKAYELV